MPKAKPDWATIRVQYVAGAKPAELAATHGVNLATLKSKASRERWLDQRQEAASIAQRELPVRVGEAIAETAAAWLAKQVEIALQLRGELWDQRHGEQLRVMGSQDGPEKVAIPYLNDPRDAKAFVGALSDLDRMALRALGLDPEGKKTEEPDGKSGAGGPAGDSDALARRVLQELVEGEPE